MLQWLFRHCNVTITSILETAVRFLHSSHDHRQKLCCYVTARPTIRTIHCQVGVQQQRYTHATSTAWRGRGERGGSYTSRVQSEKHTFLAVMVFYHHSLFTYGSQEKAFVNYQTGTLIDSFIHSIGICRMRWFLAILRRFFHSSLLCTFSCHPSPPTILPSFLTSSCHLFLGLPLNFVVVKFVYNTLMGILFSSILCTRQTNIIYLTLLSLL